jgi:hypothetical protein
MIKLKKLFQTPNDSNYFFGYYDKSPLNKDNTKLLAIKVDFIDRLPEKNDIAYIGYLILILINMNSYISLRHLLLIGNKAVC